MSGGEADQLDEERARADVYGVLAALFHAPPSAALLALLGSAPVGTVAEQPSAADGAPLQMRWRELVEAAGRGEPPSVADEYDRLFQGLGKADVDLHASFHLSGRLNERPLVDLRHALSALGIERAEGNDETEDHIAALFEVMRGLIVDGLPGDAALAVQRRFFDAHLRPWVERLWQAIEAHPEADFYASAARLARAFCAVEAEAFDLLE